MYWGLQFPVVPGANRGEADRAPLLPYPPRGAALGPGRGGCPSCLAPTVLRTWLATELSALVPLGVSALMLVPELAVTWPEATLIIHPRGRDPLMELCPSLAVPVAADDSIELDSENSETWDSSELAILPVVGFLAEKPAKYYG